MQFETERLILRPWVEQDAEALYQYAKDPAVGPIAGWPPHTDVPDSLRVIRDILSKPETYAVVLKQTCELVGDVALMRGPGESSLSRDDTEGEIGYWIGVPYWGRGLIPEAVRALIRRGFEALDLSRIWCGYFDGNDKSRRVQEKCGFIYHHTNQNLPWPAMGDVRTEHVSLLTREQWRSMQ